MTHNFTLRTSQDYHANMDSAGFTWWLDNRLIPAFNAKYPGKKMILIMDNASYHKQQSTEYYPEGKDPTTASKGLNAHVLRRVGCPSVDVIRGGVLHKFFVPAEEPAAFKTHREGGGGPAPSTGDPGTVYARAPHGPSSEELASATLSYLKLRCPEALESMVERKFAEMTDSEGNSTPWHVIWTPPYWPDCQPIELVWGGGKQRAGQLYAAGRTLNTTREHLRRGFYGGANHEGGTWEELDIPGCVRHSKEKVNSWIALDSNYVEDGLTGTLSDLKGADNWTGSTASCLKIKDMGHLSDELDEDLDLSEAVDGAEEEQDISDASDDDESDE